MTTLLGIDLGSSSVKVALVESETGRCISSAQSPKVELDIDSPEPGFAEQDPETWWQHVCLATREALYLAKSSSVSPSVSQSVSAIGIAYQMHGLVTLDSVGQPVRPAIIWCDSRAVESGKRLSDLIGQKDCFDRLLNLPGNFTFSKLFWIKSFEPDLYKKISSIMLPGDYVAYRMSGQRTTTKCALSEGILWDFRNREVALDCLKEAQIDLSLVPEVLDNVCPQVELSRSAANELGLKAGIPISYRAGDQPNNAAALGAFASGDIATTAGTSGVVYAVSDQALFDKESRVNTFLHVSDTREEPRNGVLMCVNGCGILNSWVKHNLAFGRTYKQLNDRAAAVPPGSEGLTIYPYGNGAERTLGNSFPGASLSSIDLNTHSSSHIFRATQEGIAFAMCYGIEMLTTLGISPVKLLAGKANLYLSPVFREVMVNCSNTPLTLLNSDGAVGAALMSGVGVGEYGSFEEATAQIQEVLRVEPQQGLVNQYAEIYQSWKEGLHYGE